MLMVEASEPAIKAEQEKNLLTLLTISSYLTVVLYAKYHLPYFELFPSLCGVSQSHIR